MSRVFVCEVVRNLQDITKSSALTVLKKIWSLRTYYHDTKNENATKGYVRVHPY